MARSHYFVLALLLAAHAALAQSPAFKVVFAGSNAAPLTAALKTVPANGELLRALDKWYSDTSAYVRQRRADSDGSECTLRGQPWIEEAEVYMSDRKLPALDKSCATRTEHTGRNLTIARDLVERAAAALKAAGQRAVSSDAQLRTKWGASRVFPIEGIKFEKEDQTCSLNFLAAVRWQKRWYVASAVTNRPANRGGDRLRVVEHVATDLGAPLRMQLAPEVGNGAKGALAQYTTTFARLQGAAQISRIHRMAFDDNRALNNARETNILAVDQAQDAITPANMAILILPLFMSFIPVALIADLSEVATFFYVLLTDVFAAVPFVIKGVELVITGTTETRNSETWLVGEDGGVQIAETWVATCQPIARFRNIGIVVIVVGLGAIVSGILIEYAARKFMGRARDEGKTPEPFGPALLRMDAYIPVGANYMPPTNYDDALSPNMAADMPPPPPAAAPGPAPGRITNLFSGLLRRNGPRRNDDDPQAPRPTVGISAAVVGGVRRRGTAQAAATPPSPVAGAEYEDP